MKQQHMEKRMTTQPRLIIGAVLHLISTLVYRTRSGTSASNQAAPDFSGKDQFGNTDTFEIIIKEGERFARLLSRRVVSLLQQIFEKTLKNPC